MSQSSSERRCPRCGGLVGADAEWCGQCFARLDESASVPEPSPRAPADEGPREPAPEGPKTSGSAGPVRVEGDRVLWTCATCGADNPMEAGSCTVCGTAFAALFQGPTDGATASPQEAVRRSLMFPGLGQAAVGKVAEGVARGVVFVYALATVAGVFLMRAVLGPVAFSGLLVLSGGAALALYALCAADAGRVARGAPPIVSTRALLFGMAGLILLSVVILLAAGFTSRG